PRRELFRCPPHSWLSDIENRGDDLYVMPSPALYRLPGARLKRDDVTAERIVWGIPVDLHVSCHSLAWGPEGWLYFTAGDPLLNYGDFNRPDHWGHWTWYCGPQHDKVPYVGQGGVFRCRPDGTGLEVVARGLRGCFGLAFDRDGNLFTNDNDHESLPAQYVPARLLHVTPGADFSWPRGWLPHKTPDRADLLETMTTELGRGVPCGQTYYDEPLLAECRNSLLVAQWGKMTVGRYPLVPRGASFRTEEELLVQGRELARPVGVAVGRGGRVFFTVAYMAHNEGSPTYPSELVMLTRADDAAPYAFDGYEATAATPEKLWQELSADGWQRRAAAHQELVRRLTLPREDPQYVEANRRFHDRARQLQGDEPLTLHALWLDTANPSGGFPTSSFPAEPSWIVPLSPQRLGERQAVAAFLHVARKFEGPWRSSLQPFYAALQSNSPTAQLAALAGCFEPWNCYQEKGVVAAARSDDTYLRQTACFALARHADAARLAELATYDDKPTRLAAVLAAGFRLTVPAADEAPPDDLPLTYTSPNAQFELQYADAKVDLRQLGRVGSYTIAEWWQWVRARPDELSRWQPYVDLLRERLDDAEPAVRLQAAHFLYLLNDSDIEPLVANVVGKVEESRLAAAQPRPIDHVWFVGPFDDGPSGLDRAHPLQRQAVDLAAEYQADSGAAPGPKLAWREAKAAGGDFDLSALADARDRSSTYLYMRLQSGVVQRVQLAINADDGVQVWHNGRNVYENAVFRSGAMYPNGVLLKLEPGSNDILIRVANADGPSRAVLSYRALGEVTATVPERLGLATLAERLREAGAAAGSQLAAEFLEVDWPVAVAHADAARGRKLFGADALGCVKCHAATASDQGAGAPSLAEAGKRFTIAHLVESVLLPSKQVAPQFRSSTLALDDGRVLRGLVVSETADKLMLLQPDAVKIEVPVSQIDERQIEELSAMPAGLVKTPAELADVIAYLLSAGDTNH
ncbi:MAG: hypothetical protein AB7U73_23210, partial [Pirellulales bacterium]